MYITINGIELEFDFSYVQGQRGDLETEPISEHVIIESVRLSKPSGDVMALLTDDQIDRLADSVLARLGGTAAGTD
jgi:hypothetical protein